MGVIEVHHTAFELSVERRRYERLYCSIPSDHGEMIRVIEEDGGRDIRSKGEPMLYEFFVLKLQHLSSDV